MTTLLLAGILASGGTSLENVISTPPDIYGDALKSRPIAWYRRADGKLAAGYVDKLEALGERSSGAGVSESDEDAELEARAIKAAHRVGRPATDLAGRVHGGWTVLSKSRNGSGYRSSRWVCRHVCGHESTYAGDTIYHGIPPRCQNCGER